MDLKERAATCVTTLGVKSTDLGDIPEDWEITTVGEIAEKIGSGKTPSGGNRRYVDSGRPFVRSQNVGWGRLLLDDLAFIDEATHREFPATEIRSGDVLLNITGASIGRSAFASDRLQGGNVNQHVCIVRTTSTNALLVNHLLLSAVGQSQIESFQAGGNREGLNFGQVRSIQVVVPIERAEQNAIAGVLSDADALIESLEQLLVKKRQIKQGAMQELLTGRRRLPGFAGDWEKRSLGELGHWRGGMTPSMRNPDYWQPGAVPWISSGDVKATRLASTAFSISAAAVRAKATTVVPAGSVVVVTRSGILRRYLPVSITLVEMAINQDIKALVPVPDVSSEFIAHALCHFGDAILGQCLKSGTTVESVHFPWLKAFAISVPLLGEQAAIATTLSDMDAELTALEARLAKTRLLKQGMAQALLTGRIRLV